MPDPQTSGQFTPLKTFQVDRLSVQVYDSEAEMAKDVAQLTQKHLQNTIAQQGSATVILATGNSQNELPRRT